MKGRYTMNYFERLDLGYTVEEAKYMDELERNEVRDRLIMKGHLTGEEDALLKAIFKQEEKEAEYWNNH